MRISALASKTGLCLPFVAALLNAFAGCIEDRGWHERSALMPQARVDRIETISLEKESRSEPVPVERATTQAATQAVERPARSQPAGSTVKLSIEQVRAAALATNLDLEVELVNPAIAQQVVDAERAKFEATFLGSASFKHDPGAGNQKQTYSAGVKAPLQTGTAVELNVPFTKSGPMPPRFEAGLQFSISQPLLRNAGIETNTYSIRVAEYQKGVVDAETKLRAISILADADRAYWRLYSALGQLQVARDLYQLGRKQVDDVRKRVAARASAGIEITRAESGLASFVEGLIIAETNVQARQRELKRIMNRADLPMDGETEILLSTEPNPLGLDLSPESLAQHAVENRMEMLQLELQLALDNRTIDFSRNQALPSFMLNYDYNLMRFGNTSGEAWAFGRGHNSPTWSVGLSAEIPIGNEAAKANLRRAILDRVQRLTTEQQQRLAIRQQVYDAVDQFNQDWQRILAARNEVVLAHRTYLAEQFENRLGRRTSTEVLNAESAFAQGRSREFQALAAYEISRVDIAVATGTLLGQGHVVLSPATPHHVRPSDGRTTGDGGFSLHDMP